MTRSHRRLAQVEGDLVDGRCRALLAGHEDVGRVYVEALYLRQYHARMRVDGLYLLHLVAPEHNPQLYFLEREHDVNRVAAHAETSRQQIAVAAGVERVHELAQEGVAVELLPRLDVHYALSEVLGVAHAEDARHA